ncbi:unnamed protein product [Closterium sp. NIES-54]
MNDSEPDQQVAAARHWTEWEMATSYLLPNEDSLKRGEDDKFALAFARIESHYFVNKAFARIESHYFVNKGFLPADSFLLDSVPKFRHIPAVIVQGRYDVVCPIVSAWELHKAWPEAEFKVRMKQGLPPLQVTRAATERSGASGSGGGGGGGGKNSPSWADALWRGTLRRLASFPLAIGLLFAVAGLCAVGALR